MDHESQFEANRTLWNNKTPIHLQSDFYRLDDFKSGWNSLREPELEVLGDLTGKSILHLQCHFGLDTLSMARMGARATGLDLSDSAIDAATSLSEELGLDASFVRGNVYHTRDLIKDRFDIVFTSYGTIGWLPDLKPWAHVVFESLKPGGKFIMADFHPFLWTLDDKFEGFGYDYFNTQVIEEENDGTYAQTDAPLKGKSFSWNHPISEILNALIGTGLRLESFDEYDWSAYDCFPNLHEFEPEKFRFKHHEVLFPYMYRIVCHRPA